MANNSFWLENFLQEITPKPADVAKYQKTKAELNDVLSRTKT